MPDAHHPLSHHGSDPEKIEKLIKVNTLPHAAVRLLPGEAARDARRRRLAARSLTLLYGSGMSDGNIHIHHDLPTLLVGGGAGQIKGGRHLRYPDEHAGRRTCS